MKTAFRICACWVVLLLLNGCALDTVPYLFQLGVNQAKLLSQRQPIGQVLDDPPADLSPEAKKRLGLVPSVRAFSRRIGLTPRGAYTQYAPVDLKVYVVTAAERTRLNRREWWWPIIGSVPYKGFFAKEDAAAEVRKLQDLRMDTHVRAVRAYSTLGWFNDPVVPGMLRGSLGTFVGVLIHESVHATFFRKDDTAFNEQAAVLIERAGTRLFLREVFGGESAELRRHLGEIREGEKFLGAIDGLYAGLDGLYKSALTEAEKLSRRKKIFRNFLSAHPEIRDRLPAESKRTGLPVELNNAYVLAYRLYFENRGRMRGIFGRIGRDLPKMVDLLKRAAEAEGDPFRALERLANKKGGRF